MDSMQQFTTWCVNMNCCFECKDFIWEAEISSLREQWLCSLAMPWFAAGMFSITCSSTELPKRWSPWSCSITWCAKKCLRPWTSVKLTKWTKQPLIPCKATSGFSFISFSTNTLGTKVCWLMKLSWRKVASDDRASVTKPWCYSKMVERYSMKKVAIDSYIVLS